MSNKIDWVQYTRLIAYEKDDYAEIALEQLADRLAEENKIRGHSLRNTKEALKKVREGIKKHGVNCDKKLTTIIISNLDKESNTSSQDERESKQLKDESSDIFENSERQIALVEQRDFIRKMDEDDWLTDLEQKALNSLGNRVLEGELLETLSYKAIWHLRSVGMAKRRILRSMGILKTTNLIY